MLENEGKFHDSYLCVTTWTQETERNAEWLAILLHMQEVSSSSLCLEADYIFFSLLGQFRNSTFPNSWLGTLLTDGVEET
jgi:hypothetical protein